MRADQFWESRVCEWQSVIKSFLKRRIIYYYFFRFVTLALSSVSRLTRLKDRQKATRTGICFSIIGLIRQYLVNWNNWFLSVCSELGAQRRTDLDFTRWSNAVLLVQNSMSILFFLLNVIVMRNFRKTSYRYHFGNVERIQRWDWVFGLHFVLLFFFVIVR